MAHLVLQDVDPRVIESLSARAARHGRSVEEEARSVLEGALGFSRQRALEGARRLRARWAERQPTGGGEPAPGGAGDGDPGGPGGPGDPGDRLSRDQGGEHYSGDEDLP